MLLQIALLAPPHICNKTVFQLGKLLWTLPYFRPSKIPQHFQCLSDSSTWHNSSYLEISPLPPFPAPSSATPPTPIRLNTLQFQKGPSSTTPVLAHAFPSVGSLSLLGLLVPPSTSKCIPYHFLSHYCVSESVPEASPLYTISLMLRTTV